MNLQKLLTIGALVVGAISFIMWAMVAGGNEGLITGMTYICYTLMAIAAGSTLIFSIMNIASDPAKLKKTIISLAAFGVIIIIAYAMSSGQEVFAKDGEQLVTASGSKWAETGLKSFYFLAVVSVGAMLFGGVKKMMS